LTNDNRNQWRDNSFAASFEGRENFCDEYAGRISMGIYENFYI